MGTDHSTPMTLPRKPGVLRSCSNRHSKCSQVAASGGWTLKRSTQLIAKWEHAPQTTTSTLPDPAIVSSLKGTEGKGTEGDGTEKKDSADAGEGLKKSRNRSSKNQEPVPIPDALDTPEARKALDEFREHRRQMKKPLTAMAETKLLAEWSSKGADRFVDAVNHSIARGWQGVFEASAKTNQTEMHSGIKAWLSEGSDASETAVTDGVGPAGLLEVQS